LSRLVYLRLGQEFLLNKKVETVNELYSFGHLMLPKLDALDKKVKKLVLYED